MIRVGLAGWIYPEWQGTMYPKPMSRGVDRLTYIARYFDVVEVNATFYAAPPASTAAGWLRKVTDFPDFKLTMKLWKRFTHERSEAWTAKDVADVRAALDPVYDAGRLGALLVQFPWSFRNDEGNRLWLEDVAAVFNRYPLVVEVRHESWNVPAFYEFLAETEIGFVNIDQPLFNKSIKPSARITAPTGYVRIHGRNYNDWFRKDADAVSRYDYLYSIDELNPWITRINEIAERASDTYVITNNHNLGKAGVNALELKALLMGASVAAPPTLYERYRADLLPYAHPVG